MLANLAADELDSYLNRVELVPITPQTITDEGELRSIIKKVSLDGYCYASGETSLYIQAIAVPVYNNHGKIKAALGIMNIKDGMEVIEKKEFISKNLPVLRKASEEMGALLME